MTGSSKAKVSITGQDLTRIKEFAMKRFHDMRGNPPELTQEETRIMLLFEGLYDYLKMKGVEPGFDVKVTK
jgi:hypothetical protein